MLAVGQKKTSGNAALLIIVITVSLVGSAVQPGLLMVKNFEGIGSVTVVYFRHFNAFVGIYSYITQFSQISRTNNTSFCRALSM